MKRFLSVFLLLTGFLVAGGANATVVLDTGAATSSGGVNLNSTSQPGFSFTTGPVASTLQTINVALDYSCGGGFPACQALTIKLSLYADAGGGLPANNAVPLATFTAPAAQPTTYAGNAGTLNTITIGSPLSSYTLAANTNYVLIFSQPADVSGLGLTRSGTSAAVGSSGWSASFTIPRTSDGGATWSALATNTPIFQLSAVPYVAPTAQAVPTLSEWTLMLLGLMVISMIGWHFHRERSY